MTTRPRTSLVSELPQVVEGLGSQDDPTRRMATLFLVSSAMAILTGLGGIMYLVNPDPTLPKQLTAVQKDAKQIGDFMQKQANIAKQGSTNLALGTFTIELNPVPGMRPAPGVLNLAEVEIFLQLDAKETRNYMLDHQIKLRNQITKSMQAVDREELLTLQGKKRFKAKIQKNLNEWLPEGKVEEVFFSKLLVN